MEKMVGELLHEPDVWNVNMHKAKYARRVELAGNKNPGYLVISSFRLLQIQRDFPSSLDLAGLQQTRCLKLRIFRFL